MDLEVKTAIGRAKELLKNSRHAAMATVNENGSPHNTPFFLLYDDNLDHIYWGSHPDSQHSKNIGRSGQIFAVVYDSARPNMGGVYIKAQNAHALAGDELKTGLAVHNAFRKREGKEPLPLEYYSGGQQLMYSAQPAACWVLMSQNNEKGLRIKDYRQEIDIKDLLD
ncbi:MAG TPA: pyridoxamine 5'-phosphate oxidase family protein [Candidatus Saccharimonadales bacterium]|nr:pyridoxamine 5'-phosphate oxidase family protein [Candidatus Saccharimonadales bacterium]